MIHWKLCKKLKFDPTNKWYIHNQTSVMENEMHKFLWDFEIQTNHRISTRRQDLIIINKNKTTDKVVDFAIPVAHGVKSKESEMKDKYFDLRVKDHQLTQM